MLNGNGYIIAVSMYASRAFLTGLWPVAIGWLSFTRIFLWYWHQCRERAETIRQKLGSMNKVPRGFSAATEGVSILYYREKTCGSCWDKVHLSNYKTKAINAALSLITWFFRVFLPLKQKYWCNTDMWSVRRVSILLPAGRDQHTKLRKFATILNFVSMSVH